MARTHHLILSASWIGAALLLGGCAGATDNPAVPKVDNPAVQKTAEELARVWAFGPGTQKLQAWGSELTKSGEKLVVVSCRLRDDGKAKEWFARISEFYTDKCGSGQAQQRVRQA